MQPPREELRASLPERGLLRPRNGPVIRPRVHHVPVALREFGGDHPHLLDVEVREVDRAACLFRKLHLGLLCRHGSEMYGFDRQYSPWAQGARSRGTRGPESVRPGRAA